MNYWDLFRYKMKKEYQHIILVLVIAAILIMIIEPVGAWTSIYWDSENVKFISKVIIRILILSILIWSVYKLIITPFIGIRLKIQNPLVLSLPFFIIFMGLINNWEIYASANLTSVWKFVATNLLIGLDEEFLFRGIIFPLFILAFIKKEKAIFWGVVLSSMLFGLVHFMNLRHQPGNYAGITSQVIFAFALGVFLCGLFLRTGNIMVVVLFHACINMILNASSLENDISKAFENSETPINDWSFSILSLILFAFFVFSGFFMVKQSDKKDILAKVRKIEL